MGWIKQINLNNTLECQHFFGFNNPNPSAGSPNYGYEQWVTVEIGTQGGKDIAIKEFKGELTAVARCKWARLGRSGRN